MKALAASNIGQYERSVLALVDYYRTVELGLAACLRKSAPVADPVPSNGRGKDSTIAAVVFGSDQGLVGQFDDVACDLALEKLAQLQGRRLVWAVGERVHDRLADAGLAPQALFAVPNSAKAIGPLVSEVLLATERRTGLAEGVELHLFYNRPTSGGTYTPASRRLLPLDESWRRELAGFPWPTEALPEVIGGSETLRALIREYLFISLFRACAESLAAENASRLAAMDRADRNIDGLLESLHSSFNRLRQSSIDEELFDVISGYEAMLRGAKKPGSSSAQV